jgi:hypothetical protein
MTYNTEEATILAPPAVAQGSADRGAQLDSEHVGDIRGGSHHHGGPRACENRLVGHTGTLTGMWHHLSEHF